MVYIYVRLIEAGIKTLEQVPSVIRDAVEAELINRGYYNNN